MTRRDRVRTLLADVAWRSALLMAAAAVLVALAFATGLSERAARHTEHGGAVHGDLGYGGPALRSERMMRPFVGLRPAEADQVFVADMIRHHEAAASMAASYLDLRGPRQPQVTAFARELLRIVPAETQVLALLLRMWGVAPVDHGSH
jgi:uncharacterized protein (DUF305 family)